MTCKEDNCSITLFNNSNIISDQITPYGVCSEYTYISLIVVASLFLPFNLCALWNARRLIHRECKSLDVISFNMFITSVLCFIPPVQLLVYFYLPIQLLFYIANFFTITCIVAQAQFQTWICVDQYLAVLYPVLFLKLKQSRYGLVLASFTWTLSLFIGLLSMFLNNNVGIFVFLTTIAGCMSIIFFCSVSTLATLKQTVQVGGLKRDMHLKKLKAFKIITLTLVVLMITYTPYIFTSTTILFASVPYKPICLAFTASVCLLHLGSIFNSRLYSLRFMKLPCIYCYERLSENKSSCCFN